MIARESRFRGMLLGLAVGDALGAFFEGMPPDFIASRYPTPQSLLADPPAEEMYYTDDTQMALGVAETLIECATIDEAALCRAFAGNFTPTRGYGYGARLVIEAMQEGRDYRHVAASHFPGGSFGNGAAMRVAPVGVFFRNNLDAVWEQARRSALPTHVHPLGIEGAQLLAVATALCAATQNFDRSAFFRALQNRAQAEIYREKLARAEQIRSPDELQVLGNGIAAQESVVTAIACFALAPHSYQDAIGRAILLGGDTDTIAAMAGALSGAALGVEAIPASLYDRLEDTPQGRRYLEQIAARLAHAADNARTG